MPVLRLALAQLNAVVGGLNDNVETLGRFRAQGATVGADLVVTPELSLTGYPPEDLLLREGFVEASLTALAGLAAATNLPPMLVGTVVSEEAGLSLAGPADARDVAGAQVHREPLSRLANALVALDDGGVAATAVKRLLPNYDVFDEVRYFVPGTGPHTIVNVNGVAVGLLICEDVWTADGPAAELAAQGATLIVVANASPYARGRRDEREAVLAARALETGLPIAYVNLVGGQDELVFDGQSTVVDARGQVIARAGAFREELLVVDVDARESSAGVTLDVRYARDEDGARAHALNHVAEPLAEVEEIYDALVTGTRDYLRKNGFRSAVIALSGGIDSSLVATLAVDALGAAAVRGLAMPSRYSSPSSLADALEIGRRLDVEVTTVPIEPAHSVLAESLVGALDGPPSGLTDENLQSRIRGVLLMAVSNATGSIVLTTGNKSELATGYSTLYG
ncbi:MAG: NAD(+) synthase, partial [Acidimicrobiales bacterium]